MLSGRLSGVGLVLGIIIFGLSLSHGATAHPVPHHANVSHGKAVFQKTCGVCHGLNGQGAGMAPSLKNIASRLTYAQLVGWIEKPRPPMPALYPETLDRQSVDDVAAYVATLK